MKTRTKLIALAGVAAASAYAVNRIKKTQDKKPVIDAPLPQSTTQLPKVAAKSGLSKSVIASYKTQIAVMTKTMDPNGTLTLVHTVEPDPKQGKEFDMLMSADGYEIIVGAARSQYKKVVKSDAQSVLDAVIYAAETAKSHKQKYLGWDFSA